MHVDTLLKQTALRVGMAGQRILPATSCLRLLAGSVDASLKTCTPQVAEARGNILTGYKAKFSGYKTGQMEILI